MIVNIFGILFILISCVLPSVLVCFNLIPRIKKANEETKFALANRLERQLFILIGLFFIFAYMIYKDIHW